MKCSICGKEICNGHHPTTFQKYKTETITDCLTDLAAKARNLVALSGGLQMFIEANEPDEKNRRLLFTSQAHLSLAQDALGVLQEIYKEAAK